MLPAAQVANELVTLIATNIVTATSRMTLRGMEKIQLPLFEIAWLQQPLAAIGQQLF
ncbi:hypothetical protein BH10PLA2_BH10PLA2_30610 [soil metagenome]